MKFDHLGLFVRDLADGRERLGQLVPLSELGEEIADPGLRVKVQFCTDQSGVRYELVAPYGEGNPVDQVLAGGKNVLNHVAYRIPDLDAALAQARSDGAIPLSRPQPAVAFGGARVAFVLTPLRFILEFIELWDHESAT